MLDKVIETLAAQLERDPETITGDTDIIKDLGADSLDIAELISNLEEEFDIVITEDAVGELHTVQDVADFLENCVK